MNNPQYARRFPLPLAVLLLICLLLHACSHKHDDPYRAALEKAGRNHAELEQVIRHYQKIDPDSQKLAAARFLIANMADQYTITSADTAHYRAALQEIGARPYSERWTPDYSLSAHILDSILKAYPLRSSVRWDVQSLTARQLIANIDSAFSQWRQSPWHNHYTFDEFCEWVLPYRTGHEAPEDWRMLALSNPRIGEDTIRQQDSIMKLAVLLINNTGMGYGTGIVRAPLPLTYSELELVGEGACVELSDFATKVFRSRGIPSATDLIPAWGNRSSGHAWNTIILPGGDTCKGIGYHPKGWLQMDNRVPKIYRRRYSPLRNDPLYYFRNSEAIPFFFSECNMQDVTAQYIPVSDIRLTGLQAPGNKLVWLCTFNNFSWTPVAYSELQAEGSATFRDVGRGLLMGTNKPKQLIDGGNGIAYLPATWQNGRSIPAGQPFILYEDGTRETLIPDPSHTQSITLKRKYPQQPSFAEYDKSMTGGRFQGANRADFSDSVTLYAISGPQSEPFTSCSVPAMLTGPYRYLRFLFPDDNYGNVAELRFYSGNTLLTGRTLGTSGNHQARGPEALFDNEMLTYAAYDQPDGNWAGLDFGSPQAVTNVSYRARTDDNEICPGHTYELWYWDNGWQILSRKTADNYSLTWNNVPTGTLYWVRDLTRGIEQRIFTYRNSQITWW